MFWREGIGSIVVLSCLVLAVGCAGVSGPAAAEEPNILYLTRSAAFEHGAVAVRDGQPSASDKVLTKLAGELGATITCTKDAGLICPERLEQFDLVIFYTQGDLTVAGGKDGAPGMPESGVADLIQWISDGGGFLGFHSATDTLREGDKKPTPYVQMIGAEFVGHGAQFSGTIKVVDPAHPTLAGIPERWELNEEWYLFGNFNKEDLRVLALLDPGEERAKQESYNILDYPVIWCRTLGKGRVYSTALGHREDVWTNPLFQKNAKAAMEWALGKGEAHAAPNFNEVVPAE